MMPSSTPVPMSVGLLDFFVLEASDIVDRLQRVTSTHEPHGPDGAMLLKLARELHGSATMARLTSFAEAAAGLERCARLLHEGRIAWTPALGVVVTNSVTELRALIPMARLWGDSHDQRARTAGDRLMSVLDAVERHGALMQSGAGGTLAGVTPAEASTRAVAAFPDTIHHGAIAPDVPSSMSSPVPPTPVAMRSVESASVATPVSGMAAMSDAHMPIVPIASLASRSDVNAVVYRAPDPAISFVQRFIADISPLVGSLRARLAPLRSGAAPQASADIVAAFRPVLLSLRDTAASYEHADIQHFCDAVLTAQAPLPAAAAGAIDTALTVMMQQDLVVQVRAQKLAELRRVVFAATPLSAGVQSEPSARRDFSFTPHTHAPIVPAPVAPLPVPTTARPTPAAPSGRELSSLLSSSLQKVRELDETPLDLIPITEPASTRAFAAPDGEPDVVPIDALLYRGPRALSRARHIVGQLRTGSDAHNPALIDELFDLVELAGSAI